LTFQDSSIVALIDIFDALRIFRKLDKLRKLRIIQGP
jgi:hypothetical protein